MDQRTLFPFSAIVGEDRLKLGLLLNAIDPRVGGLLVSGRRGTAKTTAVRALAALLPEIDVVDGCAFACEASACLHDSGATRGVISRRARLVNLPLGTTEDRLLGALDAEQALGHGRVVLQPGLLAAAHRGVLYVDEVNLLHDRLVDLMLDVAASGVNRIEREGLSASHPAEFVLVGSMNPDEGELRPQLLDRFGLSVLVDGVMTSDERALAVRRRLEFEANPADFVDRWEAHERALTDLIHDARLRLPSVALPDRVLENITNGCRNAGVDGLRADLAMCRAAVAHAAMTGREVVTIDDVAAVADLALLHRRRARGESGPSPASQRESSAATPTDESATVERASRVVAAPNPAKVTLRLPQRGTSPSSGRRRSSSSAGAIGAHLGNRRWAQGAPVDIDATLRAAAMGGAMTLPVPANVRRAKRVEGGASALIVLVVDASGSMNAHGRMRAAKEAALGILADARHSRDRVALVVFGGDQARLILPPTRSHSLAQRRLHELPSGGRTPLSSALQLVGAMLDSRGRRDREETPVIALLTDGRANVAWQPGADPGAEALGLAGRLRHHDARAAVIDAERGGVRLGLARQLANAMGATYFSTELATALTIREAVDVLWRPPR
jgi:magnesium chelatase subunit D